MTLGGSKPAGPREAFLLRRQQSACLCLNDELNSVERHVGKRAGRGGILTVNAEPKNPLLGMQLNQSCRLLYHFPFCSKLKLTKGAKLQTLFDLYFQKTPRSQANV